jgi:hypothetical protein
MERTVSFCQKICILSRDTVLLKGQCQEIFCFRFFHESSSPKLLKITLGSFRIYSKIRGDICKSAAPTVATTPVPNLPPVSTTPVGTLSCEYLREFSYQKLLDNSPSSVLPNTIFSLSAVTIYILHKLNIVYISRTLHPYY